ncbi:UDP-N-acetylmuramoyl-tripeptide--D-alanyl-D-alanine ligase [Roseovarius sp. 2305UL8-3]|uniref:UDP-N-acetylmuramoyl-tripeptide--D-alanyl-D- alanine ligase n=1 Tax=Roseovarius conchicola TaxID=3121636 RepID=UPI003529996A
MTLWTSDEAAAATGGRNTAPWSATGVSIDTRTIKSGDLFVALKDVRDGHEFVAQALEKGAAAALVNHVPEDVAEDAPLLVVEDVLPALEAMGVAARARTAARVVGITGSVGKTSTKEMLRDVLKPQGRTHAAEASYNNHWGVPLTLARMPADTEFAMIEIGMSNPGEIAPLARMARPHVAVITTVAAAHLEAFGHIDGIAHEKAAIFDGLEPGGVAILNGDVETAPILIDKAMACAGKVIRFGEADGLDYQLTEVQLGDEVTVAHALVHGAPLVFKLSVSGRHFAQNALAVLAAVEELGGDLGVAVTDLARWVPPAGRGTRELLQLDAVDERLALDLIDDAFNANPTSMQASLEVLATIEPTDGLGHIGKGRRIAILGDMLELGADEAQLHADLARLPSMAALTTVHCVGPRMKHLWDALPEAKRGKWVATAPELADEALRLLDAGDVVLVKGSKGSRVSLVVEALRRAGQQTGRDA